MAGPYPPPPPGGADGQPFPVAPAYPYPSGYPGPLPPPVGYSTPPRRGRPLLWTLLGLGLVAALVAAALVFGGGRGGTGASGFGDAAAKTAIQNYLTALSDGDTEAVARNNLCGMFDAIKDRKSDLALARLASDAFRKQFNQAEVISIDKVVLNSSYQAQVLFTMKVAPAVTSRKTREEVQGVAQLLRQDNQLLVCSYLLRTSAQY
ncbi:MAG: Rv0361 family membrane protein [Mycobacterium sp.]